MQLEQMFAQLQADAGAALRATQALASHLKQLVAAASDGNVRDIERSLAESRTGCEAVAQHVDNAATQWRWDISAAMEDGRYLKELEAAAAALSVQLYVADDRIHCFPLIAKLLPHELAVDIDGVRHRAIRPTKLAAEIKKRQARPARFRPETFLQALVDAYDLVAGLREVAHGLPPVVRLIDIHGALTLLPGSEREYTRHEFARDLYRLDEGGHLTTRQGRRLEFSAATGAKSRTSVLTTLTRDGRVKEYWGISVS